MNIDFTTLTEQELKDNFKEAWKLQASSTSTAVIAGAEAAQQAILAELASR